MKFLLKGIALAATAVTFTASMALAQDATAPATETEHKFEKAEAYYTECTYANQEQFQEIMPFLSAFTDMEIMAETINDPERLMKLTSVVNDPHTIHVMASCATEPVMWDTWMRNGTDMDKMVSAAAKLMNPEGMMKWMMAPMNPEIWKTSAEHMSPEKYTKWATAVVNPTFYTPVTNMADTEWYEPRLEWMTSAESYSPMVSMFSTFMAPFGGSESDS